MATPEQLLAKLAKLKVDRAKGDAAPHRPLLLLVVLELAQQGELPGEILPLTPELAFRFFTYWSIVAQRRRVRPDIRLPFPTCSRTDSGPPWAKTANPRPIAS